MVNVVRYFILFIIFAALPTLGYAQEIGKILQLRGTVQRIDTNSGERLALDEGIKVKIGETLITSPNSSASILFANSTIIQLKMNTKITLGSLRLKKIDAPTAIAIEHGKLHISSPFLFDDKSLVVTTPTAVISLVFGDCAIIVAEKETKLLVYKNKVGVANISPAFRTAYIVYPGEEISVLANRPPSPSKKVRASVQDWWLHYYQIIDNNQRIIRIDKDNGFIDWLLRKRDL